MPNQKRVIPPAVQVYFTSSKDKALLKKINAMVKRHGMTASKIGLLAIRLGLPMVERNLEGLLIDVEAQADDHKTKKGLLLNH